VLTRKLYKGITYYIFFNLKIVSLGFSELKIKLPATNTSAPKANNFFALAQ
jgi:hypothetical protein